jgi:deazaflavin-dependent oxidoreductase (nitroreductase family)
VPIPRLFARFNREVANRAIGLFAGRLPPFAIVSHRGRVTGHSFATPVLAFGAEDGLVIALFYGASSDWVRNVLAAGRAEVTRGGTTREYVQPRLVGRDEGLPLVPTVVRIAVRLSRVHDFLRVKASFPA